MSSEQDYTYAYDKDNYSSKEEYERWLKEMVEHRYPVGTEYKMLFSTGEQREDVVKATRSPISYMESYERFPFSVDVGEGYVFANGKWAEVVHEKYKVGDLVVMNEGVPYAITTNGWKGVIKEIRAKQAWVEGLDPEKPRGPFSVDYEHFSLESISAEMKEEIAAQELLAEAKKRYAPGMTVISPYSETPFVIQNGCYIHEPATKKREALVIIDTSPTTGNFLYYEGKWAEVVGPAKKERSIEGLLKEAKKRFPTGTVVKCLRGDGVSIDNESYTGVIRSAEDIAVFNDMIGVHYISGYLYAKDKWAEVVKEEEKDNSSLLKATWLLKAKADEVIKFLEQEYPEGTIVIPLRVENPEKVGQPYTITKGHFVAMLGSENLFWQDSQPGYLFSRENGVIEFAEKIGKINPSVLTLTTNFPIVSPPSYPFGALYNHPTQSWCASRPDTTAAIEPEMSLYKSNNKKLKLLNKNSIQPMADLNQSLIKPKKNTGLIFKQ